MATRRFSLILLTLTMAACPSDDAEGDTDGGTGPTTTSAPTTSTTSTTGTTTSTTTDPTSTSSTSTTTTEPSTGPDTDPAGSGSGSESGSSGSGSSTGTPACVGMSFFATSSGSGERGGNLGGLDGADARCNALAEAAGQTGCRWRAYLSTSAEDARDRIGPGPWENANGDVIAADVTALHDDGVSNGDPQHVLDENGDEIPADEHDILTGSTERGMYLDGTSCADWTSNGDARAGVGHSDIPGNPKFSPSWNAAHVVDGCSMQNLASTLGSGRHYCFGS